MKIIKRVQNIQNKTKNLGWGIAKYSPLMNLGSVENTESQFIITVGHNVHRKIKTLFLEVYKTKKYSLSIITNQHKVGDYLCLNVNEDEVIKCLIKALKAWFPEISATVLTETVGGAENDKNP